MTRQLSEKYTRLKEIISGFDSVLVAYSGGLDSAFLLFASVESLGAENVYAFTADSPSYPRAELERSRSFAQSLGLGDRYRVISTNEIIDPRYAANSSERCFFCKQELYRRLTEAAVFENVDVVFDGFNADDVGDFRPGRKAAEKFSVRSPLFEAGLTKSDLRQLAKEFELPFWDKPQSACLASRIPYGSPVTVEKLRQVEEAEAYLHSLGFRQLRVRHHDRLARIELMTEELEKIMQPDIRNKVNERFRELGFIWVALDLAGFQTGSMNKALKRSADDV